MCCAPRKMSRDAGSNPHAAPLQVPALDVAADGSSLSGIMNTLVFSKDGKTFTLAEQVRPS